MHTRTHTHSSRILFLQNIVQPYEPPTMFFFLSKLSFLFLYLLCPHTINPSLFLTLFFNHQHKWCVYCLHVSLVPHVLFVFFQLFFFKLFFAATRCSLEARSVCCPTLCGREREKMSLLIVTCLQEFVLYLWKYNKINCFSPVAFLQMFVLQRPQVFGHSIRNSRQFAVGS